MISNYGFWLISLRPHGFLSPQVVGVFQVKNHMLHCISIWYYVWIAYNGLIYFNLISCRAILKGLHLFLHIFRLKILIYWIDWLIGYWVCWIGYLVVVIPITNYWFVEIIVEFFRLVILVVIIIILEYLGYPYNILG